MSRFVVQTEKGKMERGQMKRGENEKEEGKSGNKSKTHKYKRLKRSLLFGRHASALRERLKARQRAKAA